MISIRSDCLRIAWRVADFQNFRFKSFWSSAFERRPTWPERLEQRSAGKLGLLKFTNFRAANKIERLEVLKLRVLLHAESLGGEWKCRNQIWHLNAPSAGKRVTSSESNLTINRVTTCPITRTTGSLSVREFDSNSPTLAVQSRLDCTLPFVCVYDIHCMCIARSAEMFDPRSRLPDRKNGNCLALKWAP